MSQGLSLLFIVDPLESLKAYKDSSVAMMREAARRGHDVWTCLQPSLRWRDGKVTAELRGQRSAAELIAWIDALPE